VSQEREMWFDNLATGRKRGAFPSAFPGKKRGMPIANIASSPSGCQERGGRKGEGGIQERHLGQKRGQRLSRRQSKGKKGPTSVVIGKRGKTKEEQVSSSPHSLPVITEKDREKREGEKGARSPERGGEVNRYCCRT